MRENGNNGLRAKTMRWLAVLRQQGYPIWFYKTYGSRFTRAGVADVLVAIGGQFGTMELKQPGENPTAKQRTEAQWVRETGGRAAVVHSLEEVARFLGDLAWRARESGCLSRGELDRLQNALLINLGGE